jgi:hypothetical protein
MDRLTLYYVVFGHLVRNQPLDIRVKRGKGLILGLHSAHLLSKLGLNL